LDATTNKYQPVIGLEVHVQLKTKSKIFCGDATLFGEEPNSQVSVVSLAHPGTLPKLNKAVVPMAVKMGLALNCEINRLNHFDRKHYFYPDSPSGYQITQQHNPICKGGGIPIETKEEGAITIPLTKIHLEADAGKLIHQETKNFSQVDLNRAGMPLIEMVTEPAIHSSVAAGAVLEEVRKIARFLEISDGNMEEGSLRCDANISIRPVGTQALGQKVEIKNMNSIRNVKRAIDYEIKRQTHCLENDQPIATETRLFDADTGTTSGMRSKEDAEDYRYFADPDLPSFEISEDWLMEIKATMLPIPSAYKTIFIERYGLSSYDAAVLTEEKFLASWFQQLVEDGLDAKMLANWLMGPVKGQWNALPEDDFDLQIAQLRDLMNLVNQKVVNYNVAVQQLLPLLAKNADLKPKDLISELGLEREDDADALEQLIKEMLSEMPVEVEAFKKGKKALMKRFIGETMKRSRGKADPKETAKLLGKLLS
jgi:aspartyl-tRNA(Asn)/glutamyl-tRNA(Gln) amidotransferase subunit B